LNGMNAAKNVRERRVREVRERAVHRDADQLRVHLSDCRTVGVDAVHNEMNGGKVLRDVGRYERALERIEPWPPAAGQRGHRRPEETRQHPAWQTARRHPSITLQARQT
jgi:hypothetical protein